MKTATKATLITIVGTIAAMSFAPETPLGQAVWPAKPLATEPSPGQVLGFVGMGLLAAVAFGLGIAFLVLGYPAVRRAAGSKTHALAAYVAIGWLLVSWFPHDNLHRTVGEDPAGLLALLWGFHGSLIAAGLVIASGFLRSLRVTPARAPAPQTRPVAE